MFIIGLFDTISKSIKKSVDKSYKSIAKSIKQIRLPIIKDIKVNNDILKVLSGNLSGGIVNALASNKSNLDNIQSLATGVVDVKGLINAIKGIELDIPKVEPIDTFPIIEAIEKIKLETEKIEPIDYTALEKAIENPLEFLFDLSESKLSGVVAKFLKHEVFDKIAKYDDMRKDDHITTFDDFMKFSNEIWSIFAGIKPFNIMFSKENWLDESKKGIYYDITRGFIFSYIFFTWGMGALNSFFSKMSEQKITEHYKYSKLSIQEYQRLDFRGLLNENELKDMALFLGYNERAMELTEKITKFYPSVRDSIDFAVREAFEPEADLFIHGGNAVPLPFSEIAKKLGIDDIWVKRFWHSHWRLLGSGQLLEGFHRGFLNKPELLDYLRRLDYVEKDRKLIMDMSYNLLTRVDIRRIFEQGLISSMDLYNYYGKLGFTEKGQNLMTGLAKQMRFIDTIDLRKIHIERYENGLINVNQIKELLHNTGLDLDEINNYLELSDNQRELEFLIELKKKVETKFYEGDIDFEELVQQLRSLGVSDRELKRIEKNAVLFDFRKKKLPTLAELKRYFKKNIIDLNKFVYYSLRLGLEKEHIFWILQDIS